MARPSRTLTFRSLLTATLLLILAGSVVVLVALSTFFGRRNFQMLTATIAEQTLGRVEAEVRLLLQKAQDQSRQVVQLLANRPLISTNVNASLYLVSALEAQPQLARMTLTFAPQGDFIQVERMANQRLRIRKATRIGTNLFAITLQDWPDSGRSGTQVLHVPASELRGLAIPTETLTNRHSSWSASDEWTEAGQPRRWAVRYATPIFDQRGRLTAVFSVSLALDELNRFLAALDREVPGYVAVFERGNGRYAPRLIGHPRPELAGQDISQPARVSVLDPAMVAYYQALQQDSRFTVSSRPRSDFARLFRSGSVSYFGSFNDLERSDDPPWVIAMVLPVTEVAGGVEKNLRWAALAAVAFLGLGAVVSFWLARRIAQPMLNLGAEARAMSHLDFSAEPKPLSTIREVRQLEQALGEARINLRSFRKYVPADVVRLLMESGTEARLGGQAAHLTLLFSDIVDFTHLAEATDPQVLVEQLGDYLALVSTVIHEHQGLVDKYIGDGVMAFWGAPRRDPEQALRAARTALEIQVRLDSLNAAWEKDGRPTFHTRIGLNSGDVVVGNIGSEDRMNYTAIGDPVNLASRLESLNRYYGTRILLSDATRMAAGDALLTRPVARVAVKGSQRGIVVHELLGMTETVEPRQKRLVELSESAFAALESGQAQEAGTLYRRLLTEFPEDGVATAQLQFMTDMASHHSGQTEWVRRLDTK